MCSADPKILIRKPEGKRTFGRPMYNCENIQMYLNKTGLVRSGLKLRIRTTGRLSCTQ